MERGLRGGESSARVAVPLLVDGDLQNVLGAHSPSAIRCQKVASIDIQLLVGARMAGLHGVAVCVAEGVPLMARRPLVRLMLVTVPLYRQPLVGMSVPGVAWGRPLSMAQQLYATGSRATVDPAERASRAQRMVAHLGLGICPSRVIARDANGIDLAANAAATVDATAVYLVALGTRCVAHCPI